MLYFFKEIDVVTSVNLIKKFIAKKRFVIDNPEFNYDKTCLLTPKGKKSVTGVTINNGLIKAPKEMKRNVRAMIHKAIVTGDYKDSNQIKGYVAYISSIEEDYLYKIY